MATGAGPICTCGDTTAAAGGKRRIIFPCAGQANTGQLTNLAAIQLTEEGYGNIACVALLATGSEGLVANALKVDEVLILDGCPMLCAKKIAEAQDIPVDQHIVVTDLGITKGPSRLYTDDDIETVVSAAWEGKGRI
ncbi:MAG: putative zinc-binding protein [Methanoregulaceae archaeon]|nr:putative zinc-binding protein [Methanoregulaceae archaeon]